MNAFSVLYITYDGIADHIGQSQVAPYLIGLSEQGYRITVLSVEKEHQQDIIRKYSLLFAKKNIEWHYRWYHNKPPFVSTIWDLCRMQRLARRLIRRNKVTAIHCRGYLPALIGARLKQRTGIKFIFDMRDFWADARKETKTLDTEGNLVHKVIYEFFKKKEKEFFECADQIISLTEAGKRVIQEWTREATMNIAAPITVIPCCADFAFFDPARLDARRVAEVRRSLGLAPHDFVLNYLGSLGATYLTDEMLDFFKVLLERRPNAKFLIVANNDHQIARDSALRKGLDPEKLIILRGSKEEVPYLIAQSDLAVFFIIPSFAKQACSPTKLAELLAMNVPVISNTRVGDLDAILDFDKNDSAVVTRFEKEEYRQVIDRVLQRIDAGLTNIRGNSSSFSLANGVRAYSLVYERLKNSQ